MRTTKKGKFFLYLILTLGALLILFPMRNTFEPKKSSQRAARYHSTIDTPGWNDKR